MGIFDFFKSKKEEELAFDPLDIKVENIKKGDLFDYQLETWSVIEEFEYDWGEECFTKELLIRKDKEEKYLCIDIEDGLELSVMGKVKLRSLDENFVDHLLEEQEPLKKLFFEGKKFYLNAKDFGFYRNVNTKAEGEECISWTFYDKEEHYIVTIDQWSEEEFEVSYGHFIDEMAISDILPSAK